MCLARNVRIRISLVLQQQCDDRPDLGQGAHPLHLGLPRREADIRRRLSERGGTQQFGDRPTSWITASGMARCTMQRPSRKMGWSSATMMRSVMVVP